MLRQLVQQYRRPLALVQCIALLLWGMGSVVWAYAPVVDTCPMQSLHYGQTQESVEESTPSMSDCCSVPESASTTDEQPPEEPGSHCPAGQGGRKCCCPMVTPATPVLLVPGLLSVTPNHHMLFAEPVMLDQLAPRTLVIPPAS